MKFCKYTYVLSFHFNFSVNKKNSLHLAFICLYYCFIFLHPISILLQLGVCLLIFLNCYLKLKYRNFFYFILLFIKAEEEEDCNKCYTEHLDHRYLRINVQALKDLTNARNLEKVFFILNGNNQEHKHAASFLAANLGKKYP